MTTGAGILDGIGAMLSMLFVAGIIIGAGAAGGWGVSIGGGVASDIFCNNASLAFAWASVSPELSAGIIELVSVIAGADIAGGISEVAGALSEFVIAGVSISAGAVAGELVSASLVWAFISSEAFVAVSLDPFISCIKAARAAACAGLSCAWREIKLARTISPVAASDLEFCMAILYAKFQSDATAFRLVENCFFQTPGNG